MLGAKSRQLKNWFAKFEKYALALCLAVSAGYFEPFENRWFEPQPSKRILFGGAGAR